MGPQSKLDLVNLALNGKLEDILRAARDRGESYDEISRSLIDDGVVLNRETIRRWCRDLGIVPSSHVS